MTFQNSRKGFALLIALALMSFAVLLLVAISVFTQMEAQASANVQSGIKSRQNALLALDLAVAQLQRFSGPDQRVTAPADLVADTDPEGLATSSPGGIKVRSGTRYWTGVWGNRNPNIGYTLRPDEMDADDTDPVLLSWLVSGNESAGLVQGSSGNTVPSGISAFTPETPVQNLGSSSDAFSRLVFSSGSGNVPGVVLVGANSVSDSSPAYAQESFDRGKFVAAPLVALEADGRLGGRYAWWVGDEGVKARLNLQNRYQQTGDSEDQFLAFLSSQRDGVEFVDDADGVPLGRSTYDFTQPEILRLLFRDDLPFLDPGATERLTQTAKARFHDLSPSTLGVLADTYAGGLRKSLTADILDSSNDFSYRPADSDPIFPLLSTASNEPLMPTWGVLRSWARTRPDGTGKVEPTSYSETEAGIAPVVTSASLGLNYYLEGSDDSFVMALFPMVVLFNPYPYTLEATDYDIAFRVNGRGRIYVRVDPDGPDGPDDFSNVAVFDLERASVYEHGTSPTPPDSFFRFSIRGSDIPPGESHIYCLPDSQHASVYNAPTGATLERAPNSDAIGIGNFVKLMGPDLSPTGLTSGPDAIIQLQLIDMRSTGTEVDFVLAETGSLTANLDPSADSGWYQCVTNSFSRGGALVANTLCDLDTSYSDVSSRRGLGGFAPFTHATSALRLTAYTDLLDTWLASDRWGFSFTKVRQHAALNFRASVIEPTLYERDNQPDDRARMGAMVMGSALIGANSSRNKVDDPHINFSNFRYAMNYGQTLNASSNPSSAEVLHHNVFFDLLATPDNLLSLGQLQNVPFSRYSFQPTYPFANSYADPRIPRDQTYRSNIVYPLDGGAATLPTYDLSWLLNRALWDRYFLSGVPEGWGQSDLDAGRPLPNSRMNYQPLGTKAPELSSMQAGRDAYNEAAAHLMVEGSFNVNSTSEQAWRAVLSGAYGIPAESAEAYAEAEDLVNEIIPFPRFTHNMSEVVEGDGPYSEVSGTMVSESPLSLSNFFKTAFLGNRGLYLGQPIDIDENPSPEAVVAELARSIVEEIRKRGPFLSLADFINRPLTPSADIRGVKGALQAGIDGMNHSSAQVNPYAWTEDRTAGGLRIVPADPNSFGHPPDWDPEHTLGGLEADRLTPADPYQMQPAMAPFFLTQADLLSSLGPRLSARSDTFLIRTYGEVVDPLSGEIESRAWCEAVVQRMPEYVDESEDPEDTPTGLNAIMGRRYEVVSVRWLSPEMI